MTNEANARTDTFTSTGYTESSLTELRKYASGVKTDNSSTQRHQAGFISSTTSEKLSTQDTRTIKENMDNILLNEDAQSKLIAGADKVAEPVALTLGPTGATAVIEVNLHPSHKVVDDGVSVAHAIHLEDPYENMGANLMKEITGQADKESGDGTSTATVIAQSLLHQVGISRKETKQELDKALKKVFEAIDKETKEIDPSEVDKVAYTSSNDKELSLLLKDIYQKVGREGIVELDNSNLPETFYEMVEGVRFRGAGYLGQYSCTEPGKAIYTNPRVLVSREKITSVNQIEPTCVALAKQGINELVIFCDEIDMSVASRLALTHLQGQFKTLIIKVPTLFKEWLFEDFALVTGATVIDGKEGKTFKNLMLSDLGTCDKIVTTNDETRVLGIKDISGHIIALKEKAKEDDNIPMRLSWLQTKVAILKMGANSEAELSTKRAKAIDAISACHHALEGGVIAGGGRVLAEIQTGNEMLDKALKAPLIQMEKNMGEPMPSKEELIANGILDPANIIKNSVKAAVSVAGTFLTTKIAIKMKHETPRQMPFMPQA